MKQFQKCYYLLHSKMSTNINENFRKLCFHLCSFLVTDHKFVVYICTHFVILLYEIIIIWTLNPRKFVLII